MLLPGNKIPRCTSTCLVLQKVKVTSHRIAYSWQRDVPQVLKCVTHYLSSTCIRRSANMIAVIACVLSFTTCRTAVHLACYQESIDSVICVCYWIRFTSSLLRELHTPFGNITTYLLNQFLLYLYDVEVVFFFHFDHFTDGRTPWTSDHRKAST
jgi:hypothetical protein